jgi:hypothetical protein
MNVMRLFNVSPIVKTYGEIGIEIEVEGTCFPYRIPHWKREHDGSLHGGVEFVLRKPLTLLGARIAMKEMTSHMSHSSIRDSVRAGVHVHLNCQNMTKVQVFNTIIMWALFEEVLLNKCGVCRKGNLFCVPLGKSDNVISFLRDLADDDGYAPQVDNDDYRYCAINIVALRKYGSLEFRAMRTSADMDNTYQWAKLLHYMKKVACTYKNPMHILDELESKGVYKMFVKVFAKSLPFLGRQVGLVQNVNKCLMTANTIAYASDWDAETDVTVSLDEGMEEPEEHPEEFDFGENPFANVDGIGLQDFFAKMNEEM